MIVSPIQINWLIRYRINCRHLSLFGLRYPLYCHVGKLIKSQHLIETIFKPQEKPLLTRHLLHQPSQLLANIYGNLSLNYYSNSHTFDFTTVPICMMLPLPLNLLCGGLVETDNNNKQQVSSLLVECIFGVIISGIQLLFQSFAKNKKTTKQDRMQTNFFW